MSCSTLYASSAGAMPASSAASSSTSTRRSEKTSLLHQLSSVRLKAPLISPGGLWARKVRAASSRASAMLDSGSAWVSQLLDSAVLGSSPRRAYERARQASCVVRRARRLDAHLRGLAALTRI